MLHEESRFVTYKFSLSAKAEGLTVARAAEAVESYLKIVEAKLAVAMLETEMELNQDLRIRVHVEEVK